MQNYPIGSRYFMAFGQGNKCERDYIIMWNGETQFSDISFFNLLNNNITCYRCAFNFVKHFINNPFVVLEKECVKTNIMDVQNVIDYINQTLLPNDLKLCLASMIFRCDIDNINYECPRLNGCVRHFLQVLMLFGYKFNLSNWQMPKLNLCIQANNTLLDNIPNLVSHIGYPNNSYKIYTDDFKSTYKYILPNLQQILSL